MQTLKIAGLAAVGLAGAAILGLVFYSYFFTPGGYRPPEISEVRTSELVIRTPQGIFLDKDVQVFPDTERAELRYVAPDFELIDFKGNRVQLSDLRGKPVLLNFWATWCPPCRKEMPDLQSFHEQFGDRITIIGINWNDDLEKAQNLLDSEEISYTNLIDEGGKVFVDYRLVKLPVSFWLDEQGVIRGYWEGAMSEKNMLEGFEVTTNVFDNETGF